MTREIENIINGLERERFYGSLELRFENGRITVMRKSQTIKPSTTQDYRDNRGADHVGRV